MEILGAMPYIRHLVTGFSLLLPGFDPRSHYVGFPAGKMTPGHILTEYIEFPCNFSFHELLHIL
jgi:hypothetical protein